MSVEWDDLEGLTKEIHRLIEGNRQFLDRVNDEEFEEDDPEPESEADPDPEDFEEL